MNSTIVLFNRPIWVVKEEGDVRNLMEIYGFLIERDIMDINKADLDEYLEYLCGISKWEQEGNSIVDWKWVSSSGGDTYLYQDPYIMKYCKTAKHQMYLTYLIFQTNKILERDTPSYFEREMLISRELYNNILEYGVIVE